MSATEERGSLSDTLRQLECEELAALSYARRVGLQLARQGAAAVIAGLDRMFDLLDLTTDLTREAAIAVAEAGIARDQLLEGAANELREAFTELRANLLALDHLGLPKLDDDAALSTCKARERKMLTSGGEIDAAG